MDVATLNTHSEYTVEIPALALHPRGSGINYMPQPGDFCYIGNPADKELSKVVLGFFIPADEDKGSRGERPDLKPGDVAITTQDDNFVFVRRGGLVEIGASALAQTVYIPVENAIRTYFQKYHAFSPLGEIVWEHGKIGPGEGTLNPEKDDIPALVKYSSRELVNDKNMSIELRMGRLTEDILDTAIDANLRPQDSGHEVQLFNGETELVDKEDFPKENDREHLFMAKSLIGQDHPDDHPWKGKGAKSYEIKDQKAATDPASGLLSLTVMPSDSDGTSNFYTFQVNKEGSNFVRSESHIHTETGKGFFLHANEDPGIRLQTDEKSQYLEIQKYIRMETKKALAEILDTGEITLRADAGQKINLEVGSASIIIDGAENTITMKAATIDMDAENINLGKGATKDLLANAASWKSALDSHTHSIPALALAPAGGGTVVGATGGPVTPPTAGGDLTSATDTKVKVN